MSEPVVTDDGYDVVIVGAGIAGATAAKVIADHGGEADPHPGGRPLHGYELGQVPVPCDRVPGALAKVPNSPYADNPNAPQPSVLSIRQLLPGPAGRAPAAVLDTGGYFVQTGPLPFSSTTPAPWGGPPCTGSAPACGCSPTTSRCGASTATAWTGRSDTGTSGAFTSAPSGRSSGGRRGRPAYPGIDGTYFGGTSTRWSASRPAIWTRYSPGVLTARPTVQDHDYEVWLDSVPAGRNSTPRDGYQVVGAVGESGAGAALRGQLQLRPDLPGTGEVQRAEDTLRPAAAAPRHRRPDRAALLRPHRQPGGGLPRPARRARAGQRHRVPAYDDEGSPRYEDRVARERSTSWRPTPSRTRRCCWHPARRTRAALSAGT